MNTEFFIARRFIKSQSKDKRYTMPIIRLSVISIALSLTVMILAVSIVTGFKQEIRNRVVGFSSHIQIENLDLNNSFVTSAINRNQDFLPKLRALPGIKHIQVFASKPGMIKTTKDMQGIIVKGIDTDFDWNFFEHHVVEGDILKVNDSTKTNKVLISTIIGNLLNLKVGDEFAMFFIDKKPRMRRFEVGGLYKTSLEQFDKQIMIADIKHIQRLNKWSTDTIGGFEIILEDFENIDYITSKVKEEVEYRFASDGSRLEVKSIKRTNPQIFDWLELLDMNVWVILIIMVIVSIINMVSGLIILILDRTFSIGLLKALGTSNKSVRNIFLYQSLYLIIKGLFWGNIVSICLMYLQDKFHLIKLDQSSYFIDYAPVNFNLLHLFVINISALCIIFIFMLLPVIIVSRIQPVKTLRYN